MHRGARPAGRRLPPAVVETVYLNPVMTAPRLLAPLAVAALAALSACSTQDLGRGDGVDYRSQAAKTRPLEIPPDLSQLAREGRYQPQSGVVVSASTLATAGGATTTAGAGAAASGAAASGAGAAATVDSAAASTDASAAASAPGTSPTSALRIERDRQTRWLVSPLPPERLYPQVKAFWAERGFALQQDTPELGLMQTDWAENRAKVPQDMLRRALGTVIDGLYSTGERDLFRTRIERSADGGSEVYVSHRGLEEVVTGQLNDSTRWQPRASDPELEAEMLARLLLTLGGAPDLDRARKTVAAVPEAAPRARDAEAPTTLELDEGLDRAWRQVGLALDRSGFTVEDRDRSAGVYYVRYTDPKRIGQEEPGFWSRLFSKQDTRPAATQRYRIQLQARGDKTWVAVQDAEGRADTSEVARQMLGSLLQSLR